MHDKLVTVLSQYITDSSPEVRFNARNAFLSMEYGQNAIGSKLEIERYIKKVIAKKFD